jgi:hypothetical protein
MSQSPRPASSSARNHLTLAHEVARSQLRISIPGLCPPKLQAAPPACPRQRAAEESRCRKQAATVRVVNLGDLPKQFTSSDLAQITSHGLDMGELMELRELPDRALSRACEDEGGAAPYRRKFAFKRALEALEAAWCDVVPTCSSPAASKQPKAELSHWMASPVLSHHRLRAMWD